MELIQVETLNAVELFDNGLIESVIEQVKKRARSEVYDVETKEGRDGIKSLAYKIARSKTALDDMGKEHVADLKKKTKEVDAQRRKLKNELDNLKNEIRKPLTEFEQREEKRKQAHRDNIEKLRIKVSFNTAIAKSSEILKKKVAVAEIVIDDTWEEYKDEALMIVRSARQHLSEAYEFRKAQEEEQEKLRKEAEERERKAKEEAEKLRKEREELEQKQREQEEKLRLENEKREREAQERERKIKEQEEKIRKMEEAEKERLAAEEAARAESEETPVAVVEEKIEEPVKVSPLVPETKLDGFEDACKPLIKWLNDNGNPHMTAVVNTTGAELMSGEKVFTNFEFVKD